MSESLKVILFEFVFYSLGGIGLFAIGAIPFRAVLELKNSFLNKVNYIQIGSLVAVFIITISLIISPLIKVSHCLLGYHCSANAAGGWINSAYIGCSYILFEIALLIIRKTFQRRVK